MPTTACRPNKLNTSSLPFDVVKMDSHDPERCEFLVILTKALKKDLHQDGTCKDTMDYCVMSEMNTDNSKSTTVDSCVMNEMNGNNSMPSH